MSIVVLDVGKTNVKLVVVDEDGNECHTVTRPNFVLPGPPYPHCDVETLWRWILDELTVIARNHAIGTIVPVVHGACAALVAGDGLAMPVIDYEYDGPDSVDDAYAAAIDPFAETLSPLLPLGLNVGKQLFWQRQEFPGDFARATALLTWAQYWSWWLSGVPAAEITSIACHTHLWYPGAGTVSDFARTQGFADLLPPMRSAWESLGPIRPGIAAETGLAPDCRVLCGIHDSNASYLPHLAAHEPPFTVVSTGTWVICMAAGGDPGRLDETRDMLANVDATGAPVPCARFMGGREFAAIAGEGGAGLAVGAADMQALVDSETLPLPSFAPDSGPFQRHHGTIIGPAPETATGWTALASLYCALVTDDCLDRLGAGGPLFVEGSFARNTAYLGILAGLRPTQRVMATGDGTGTVSGAMLLAAWPPRTAAGSTALPPVVPLEVTGLTELRNRWRERTR